MRISVLSLSCACLLSACIGEEEADTRPYATEENAKIAAKTCGIESWSWQQYFAFDGPQPDQKYFSYEASSLPSEEIESERGRTWDRSVRIEKINKCILNSFRKQGVRIYLGAPGLLETIVGSSITNEQS